VSYAKQYLSHFIFSPFSSYVKIVFSYHASFRAILKGANLNDESFSSAPHPCAVKASSATLKGCVSLQLIGLSWMLLSLVKHCFMVYESFFYKNSTNGCCAELELNATKSSFSDLTPLAIL
jgi:hypothetical protein